MYEFVDTIERNGGSAKLPAEAMYLNGTYIENMIDGYRTLYVRGRELVSTEISETTIGDIDGSVFQCSRVQPRTITVGYQLIAKSAEEFRRKFNELNAILSTPESRLIFNDENDKYWIGSKKTSSDVPEGLLCTTSEFEMYCTDPKKYSLVQKEFTAAENEDGILELLIENNGTEDATIDYDIQMGESENGYIGIVSEHGVMQYGDASEVDYVMEQYSEVKRSYAVNDLISTIDGKLENRDLGAHWGGTDYQTQGSPSFKKAIWYGKEYMVPNSFGSNNGAYHGPSKLITLDDDEMSDNFYLELGTYMQTQPGHSVGYFEIVVADEELNRIATLGMWSPNTKWPTWYLAGFEVHNKRMIANTNTGFWVDQTKTAYDQLTSIDKKGEKIIFTVNGKKYTYSDDGIKEMKAKYISIFMGQKTTYPYLWMGLSRLIYRKDNMSRAVDIPNRYQPGTMVQIDGDYGRVYVDGVRSGDECVGTKYFKAPPGETKVQIVVSDFCTNKPTVKARIRERWL